MKITTREIAGALQRQHRREGELVLAIASLCRTASIIADSMAREGNSEPERGLGMALQNEIARAIATAEADEDAGHDD